MVEMNELNYSNETLLQGNRGFQDQDNDPKLWTHILNEFEKAVELDEIMRSSRYSRDAPKATRKLREAAARLVDFSHDWQYKELSSTGCVASLVSMWDHPEVDVVEMSALLLTRWAECEKFDHCREELIADFLEAGIMQKLDKFIVDRYRTFGRPNGAKQTPSGAKQAGQYIAAVTLAETLLSGYYPAAQALVKYDTIFFMISKLPREASKGRLPNPSPIAQAFISCVSSVLAQAEGLVHMYPAAKFMGLINSIQVWQKQRVVNEDQRRYLEEAYFALQKLAQDPNCKEIVYHMGMLETVFRLADNADPFFSRLSVRPFSRALIGPNLQLLRLESKNWKQYYKKHINARFQSEKDPQWLVHIVSCFAGLLWYLPEGSEDHAEVLNFFEDHLVLEKFCKLRRKISRLNKRDMDAMANDEFCTELELGFVGYDVSAWECVAAWIHAADPVVTRHEIDRTELVKALTDQCTIALRSCGPPPADFDFDDDRAVYNLETDKSVAEYVKPKLDKLLSRLPIEPSGGVKYGSVPVYSLLSLES